MCLQDLLRIRASFLGAHCFLGVCERAVMSKSCHMSRLPLGFVCRERELAVDTFLPLLNQLISRSCCQEGVRLGGLGGAAHLGVVMPKPEIQGLASLPKRKRDTPLPFMKIKPYTMTKHLQTFHTNALLPLLVFVLAFNSISKHLMSHKCTEASQSFRVSPAGF